MHADLGDPSIQCVAKPVNINFMTINIASRIYIYYYINIGAMHVYTAALTSLFDGQIGYYDCIYSIV